MSIKQFGRSASLVIGQDTGDTVDLSKLRFTFRVKRGDLQTPNSARIRVYNVAPGTAQKAQLKEFSRVVLQAGYEGNYGIIFDGSIVQVRNGRENATDTYFDITAADGDMAYNFAVVSTTLASGATQVDIVDACLKTMGKYGVTLGYIPDLPPNPLPRGKVLFGMARDHLETVARSTQTLWSIQDGKLQIVPETSYVPGDVPVINANTGMVGLPEQTQNGITIRTLLNPSIKIGRLIHLNNRSIQEYEFSLRHDQQITNWNASRQNKFNSDGYYYVMTNEHWGDTRGNDWYTEAICLAVDATPIDTELLTKAEQGVSGPVPPKLDVVRPYG
jgi:hypothetical protein